jgi:Ca2+-binding RTX toxin-like protein
VSTRLLIASGATVASLALASSAGASTVSVASGKLTYAAASGEVNQLQIDQGTNTFRVVDSGATITVGSGCTLVSGTTSQATCPASGITSVDVAGGDQNDSLRILSSKPTTVNAGAGDDTVATGAGDDVVDLGTSASATSSFPKGDSADTGAGADTVTARGILGVVSLGAGADTFRALGTTNYASYYSSSDRNVVNGGADNDTLDASAAKRYYGTTLNGNDGDDVIKAAASTNGSSAYLGNVLTGGAGNDALTGSTGGDVLQGGAGRDTYKGGAGVDVVSYSDHTAAVTATLDGAANDGPSGEAENVPTDVEGLYGGAGNDTLTASTTGAGTVLSGCGGNDTLTGTPGDDQLDGDYPSVYFGNSYLASCTYGTSGADKLVGGDGDDNLGELSGADSANGGPGVDSVSFRSTSDPVAADPDGVADDGVAGQKANIGTTVERIVGGYGNDTISGNAADNVLVGGGGNDTLSGGDGDDIVCGGDSNLSYSSGGPFGPSYYDGPSCLGGFNSSDVNVLNGGNGDDVLAGTTRGADTYAGGAGSDLASFAYTSEPITASNDGVANDGVTDQKANVKTDVEAILGGSGNDTLTGGANADVLNGGLGSDALNGAGGNDLLYGGASQYSASSQADVFAGGAGVDTVSFADQVYPTYSSYPGAPGTPGVTVTLDGTANDGFSGGTSNLKTDVENVVGTNLNDTITGSASNNVLLGTEGDDTIKGAGANDTVDGGLGLDKLAGDAGNDLLQARDGVTGETADCGVGTDRAVADSGDTLTACETTSTAAARGSNDGAGAGSTAIENEAFGSRVVEDAAAAEKAAKEAKAAKDAQDAAKR